MIEIPLNTGLITQVDPQDVGLTGCTVLTNAEFDKLGIIYKTLGRGSETNTTKTLAEVKRWLNTFFTDGKVWIVVDTAGQIWYTYNLTSFTSLVATSSTTVNLYDHGTFLRASCGKTQQPRTIQHISSRNFFYDSSASAFLHSFNNIYVGLPPKYPTTFTIVRDATYTKLNEDGGGNLPFVASADKTVYYKFTAVFDGVQELPFKDEFQSFAISGDTDPNDNVQIRLKFDEDDWDPRITQINMYRAITDSEVPNDALYRQINTFSTTEGGTGSWLTAGNGQTGRTIFAPGTAIDSAVTTSHSLYWADSATALAQGGFTGSTGNQRGIQAKYTNHLNLTVNFDTNDHWGATKHWSIRSTSNLITNDNFESDITGWTYESGLASVASDSPADGSAKAGSKVLIAKGTAGTWPNAWIQSNLISASSGEVFFISAWIDLHTIYDGVSTNDGLNLKIQAGNSSWTDIMQTSGTSVGGALQENSDGWVHYYGKYTASADFYVRIYCISESHIHHTASVSTYSNLHLDAVQVFKEIQGGTTVSSGHNVFALQGAGVGVGSGQDKVAKVGAYPLVVSDNITDVFKTATASPFSTSSSTGPGPSNSIAITSQGDQWSSDSGNVVYLDTFDTGVADGSAHPLANVSSTEVNYTYSVATDGRLFVAGVRLDPRQLSGGTEDHDNWIIFSELNQYDILPISNYIQLTDLQGGSIVGLASLMGDLVVLMERGIYRLSVPSSDPTSWSLSESEENIGCISPDSVCVYEDGVFFASKSHIYHINSNFQISPITESIRDDYQSLVSASTLLFVDVIKNDLIVKLGSNIYCFDLDEFKVNKERWSRKSMTADFFAIDEDLDVKTFYLDTTTKTRDLHPDSVNETTAFQRTTGWFMGSDLEKSLTLRRINFRYNTSDTITVKVYIDGDDSTIIKTLTLPADTSGADWYRLKPGVRGRYFKIDISTTATTNAVELRRIEVEVG